MSGWNWRYPQGQARPSNPWTIPRRRGRRVTPVESFRVMGSALNRKTFPLPIPRDSTKHDKNTPSIGRGATW